MLRHLFQFDSAYGLLVMSPHRENVRMPVHDRRVAVRHRPRCELPCRVSVVLSSRSWPARVSDLCRHGIGILSNCWIPTETPLLVTMGAPSMRAGRVVLVRLCHATPTAKGEYHLGAAIVQGLTDQQVLDLLQ